MYDANLVDFYKRVAHFEKQYAKGMGHEAVGTLGRSYARRKQARRTSWVFPLFLVIFCAFGLKGTILHVVGAESYQSRLDGLNAGEGFDRLGGWLMQIDPVTAFVAQKIGAVNIALAK